MHKPSFDPGLSEKFAGPLSRAINKDGSFNVRRVGGSWRDVHPYLHLVNMKWPAFLALILAVYVAANTVFAAVYFSLGPDQLAGADAATAGGRFLNDFFFSSHTLSTVGYGNIAPKGLGANIVSSFEALVGVLGFALGTGLLFGRVSRPSARIGFSPNLLVTPYQDGTSLQFRVVNNRSNSLMDLEARVLLMVVEAKDGWRRSRFHVLKLERPSVLFLPLTWTVVHPIDSDSPLWGLTREEVAALEPEVMIMIKAYDDTFAQTVLARYSYRIDEMVWNGRFAPAFEVDPKGNLVLEMEKVGELL